MREGSQSANAIPLTEHELIALLRPHIPVEGDDWTYLWHLTVQPGSNAFPHSHNGWTACYYEDVGDPPCAIILNGERIVPKNGDIIVVPPGVEHSVETNEGERPRLSHALTLNKGDNRQVIKDVIR